MNWDTYGMLLAHAVALKSKDPNTRIGAVVLGPDHEIRSAGFNGLPRGVKEDAARNAKPAKYSFWEHGERNAVYNAARMGVSLLGCTMFTQGTPCCDCARAIIQAGISCVVVDFNWDKNNATKWAESAEVSKEMFREAEVKLIRLDFSADMPGTIDGLHDGKTYMIDNGRRWMDT